MTEAPPVGDIAGPKPGSLEHWAREKPDAPALIEGDRVLTWKAWNDLADRLAEGLARRGLKVGDILVTRMQIRCEWPIVSAAAGKLGLRILGLNWRLTPAETRYVLSNSGASAILCDDEDPAALTPALDGLRLKLAASIDVASKGYVPYANLISHAPDRPRFAAGNPQLILYTSGTTGLPKGVSGAEREHDDPEARRRLSEYKRSVAASGAPTPGGVALITMPMHHGAGPALIWGATAMGLTMVVLRRFDPEEALRLIERNRVTNWTGVPTMFKRVAGLPPEVLANYDVSSIRTLGVGAAPVSYGLKEWIIGHFGEVLGESYGATETGMLTVLSPEMQRLKPGSSGRPYAHVILSIRDADGRDLPAGAEGEIWAKTPRVIRQYLNAPPLGPDILDENGFFRTGDIGRMDEDGYLFITDRAKDMIVAGGVNIYPAEIEAAILTHPAVQDAAVIGVPNDDFGEEVKAFVELKPGRMASEAEILDHCKDLLASYKRPRSLEILAELPRNTVGKLLKRELRDPYWKGRERNV